MQKAIGSGSHVSRSATGLGLIALAACLSASISLLIGYAGWGDSLRVAPAASVVLLGGAGLVWVVSAGLLFRDLRRALAAYAQATEVGHRLAGELKASRSVVRHTPGLTATFSADLELRELLGASTLEGQEARGKRLFRPADLALLQRTMANLADSGGVEQRVEFQVHAASRGWRTFEGHIVNAVDDPAIQGFILRAQDVTRSRQMEQELRRQAYEDPVTRLPNRAFFLNRLTERLESRPTGVTALLMMDLDRFKLINDTLGHSVGDQLLEQVALRLVDAVGAREDVARLGGDEYAALLQVSSMTQVRQIADRVLEEVRLPIQLQGHETVISASIGIAVAAREGVPDELLRRADAALYRAKDAGRSQYAFFDDEEDPHTVDRLRFEADLRRAIERDQLRLEFQPEVDLRTGHIVGAETLVRWDHPVRGMLQPMEFIPLAEDTGEILALGEWILTEACRTGAEWIRMHRGAFTLGVNLSAREFADPNLVLRVTRAIHRFGIRPQSLRLELTESVLLRDTPATNETLSALDQLGVQLAIDDFGTGYSSLSYLRRLPVEVVKIDRSFVVGLEAESQHRAIVRAVISLADTLGVATVAEVVESSAELRALMDLGCLRAQGNHFSTPISASALQKLLVQRRQFEALVGPRAESVGTESEPSQSPREALFDPITELPNSTLYEDRLDYSLASAARRNEVLGVGLISFGSRVAPGQLDSTLLRELGQGLRDAFRTSDTVAHFGRGRFGVILNDAANAEGVRNAARRVFLELGQGLGMSLLSVSATAGFAVSLPPHQSVPALLAETETSHLRAIERRVADVPLRAGDWAEVAIFDASLDRAIDAGDARPEVA